MVGEIVHLDWLLSLGLLAVRRKYDCRAVNHCNDIL